MPKNDVVEEVVMGFVPAKCTQCDGILEIDNEKDAAICKYCGTPFIVEKAINHYNNTINNNITNNNRFYGTVNMNSNNEFEELMEKLDAYRKLGDEKKEQTVLYKLYEKYPDKSETWYEMIRTETNDFNPEFESLYNIKNYIDNIEKLGNRQDLMQRCTEYYAKCRERRNVIVDSEKNFLLDFLSNHDNLNNLFFDDEFGYTNGFICEDNALFWIEIDWEDKQRKKYYKKATYGIMPVVYHGEVGRPYLFFEVGCNKEKLKYHAPNVEGGLILTLSYKDVSHIVNKEYAKTEFRWYKNEKYRYLPNKNISSTGCYIATCVYGSYDCPQVWTLRRFRDYTLDKTWYGKVFIKCYYTISPKLVKWFGNQKWFRTFWRKTLDVMVKKLNSQGIECTQYHDKY